MELESFTDETRANTVESRSSGGKEEGSFESEVK